MELYKIADDIKVFGLRADSFPEGIGETFENLAKSLTNDFDRSFFGISKMTNVGIVYVAAVKEKFKDEADLYQYQQFTIEKGDYLITALQDWRKKPE